MSSCSAKTSKLDLNTFRINRSHTKTCEYGTQVLKIPEFPFNGPAFHVNTHAHTLYPAGRQSNMHKDEKQGFNKDSEVEDYKLLYTTVNDSRFKLKMKVHKMVSRERQSI